MRRLRCPRDATERRPGRASGLGGWLFVLAAVGAAVALCRDPNEGAATPAEERDPPFAQLARAGRGAQVCALAVSPEGTRVASGTITGGIWLEDLMTGRTLRVDRRSTRPVWSLRFSPDGRLLAAAGDDGAVGLWAAASGMVVDGPEVEAKTIAFSSDGRLLAAGRYDGSVTLWVRATGRRRADLAGHRGGVNALDFSADDRRLATGGSDGMVKIWDTATGRELATLDDHEPWAPSVALDFSPDGKRLATAKLWARAVHLWDPATGEPLGRWPASDFGINALTFSPDGTLLATAEGDGTAVLWDAARGRPLGRVRAQGRALLSVAFSGDGRLLATGGRDGCVRLWDVRRAIARGGAERAGQDPVASALLIP